MLARSDLNLLKHREPSNGHPKQRSEMPTQEFRLLLILGLCVLVVTDRSNLKVLTGVDAPSKPKSQSEWTSYPRRHRKGASMPQIRRTPNERLSPRNAKFRQVLACHATVTEISYQYRMSELFLKTPNLEELRAGGVQSFVPGFLVPSFPNQLIPKLSRP